MSAALSLFRPGRRLFLAASLVCAMFAAPLQAADATDAPDESLSGSALLSALRAGGLILYFRHTSTDFGQNDDQMSGYEDCARQRNLTSRGRDEARAIADHELVERDPVAIARAHRELLGGDLGGR
jgi:hypothetical protein